MEIAFLKQHTDSIPVIAGWYYREWGAIYDASGMYFEDVKRTIVERANTDRIPLAIVALDGGRVVGTGCLKLHDTDTRSELTLWIVGIYVEQNQRRKGLGSTIVSTLEGIAKNFGTQRLYLYTPHSAEFYARLGWGEYERTTYKGQSVTIMEKILS